MRRAALLLVLLLALPLGACSPEADRTRGSGPGADPGNYGDEIRIRGERDPFHATPRKAPR